MFPVAGDAKLPPKVLVGTIEQVRLGGIGRDDEKHRTKFKVSINDPILYLPIFVNDLKASIGIGYFRINVHLLRCGSDCCGDPIMKSL